MLSYWLVDEFVIELILRNSKHETYIAINTLLYLRIQYFAYFSFSFAAIAKVAR